MGRHALIYQIKHDNNDTMKTNILTTLAFAFAIFCAAFGLSSGEQAAETKPAELSPASEGGGERRIRFFTNDKMSYQFGAANKGAYARFWRTHDDKLVISCNCEPVVTKKGDGWEINFLPLAP